MEEKIRVYIDGDGCPVVRNAIKICNMFDIECTVICDNSHIMSFENAKAVTVDKGADSADFAVVNMLRGVSVVVTQDYGLAAMCLAKGASVINQDGNLYTKENIDGLLFYRYESKKMRERGRIKGNIPKRSQKQNEDFEKNFTKLIKSLIDIGRN